MTGFLSALSGGQFLTLYAVLIAVALVGGGALVRRLRPEGRYHRIRDEEALAVLAGGPRRHAEMVVARSFASGAIAPDEAGRMTIVAPGSGDSPAERTLTAGGGSFGLGDAVKVLRPHGEAVRESLVESGLLLNPGERWRLRLVAAAPLALVFALGWYRRAAGLALGEPVGFLTAMMALAAILAVVRLVWLDPLTRAGQDAIARARGDAQRLRQAPTRGEMGLGVALFGTAILAGTPYEAVHAMRRHDGGGADGGSSDGGSGCGGGGSGCGGGGCGGCGG